MIKIIAGLGNPGLRYAQTRHNVGFMVVDEFARRMGATFGQRPGLEVADVRLESGTLWLIKPQQFMNLSGRALIPFMRFFKIEPQELLVVHDDMDLPLGRLRLREHGSSGGQNGVADIIYHLESDQFSRLKIGISRPEAGHNSANWVLSNFTAEETALLTSIISAAADGLGDVIAQGIKGAQNQLNAVDLRPAPSVHPRSPEL